MKNQLNCYEKVKIGTIHNRSWLGYTLRNSKGMELSISNLGGIITSLKVPDKRGQAENIVLNYELLDAYRNNEFYLGAIIGRYANRIAKGSFCLDGVNYQLEKNNGPNHLHGGKKGFDQMLWKSRVVDGSDFIGLELTYLSKDGEEGYPGNLDVRVVYKLTDDNELKVDYHATTDKACPVNLTQHSYFNLSANFNNEINEHELYINADHYLPIDANSIPLGAITPVANTPFDFRTQRTIGGQINKANKQLDLASGFDHNFVLKNKNDDELKLAAKLFERTSGRVMEVYTTKPGMQLYTGNFLKSDNKTDTKQKFNRRCGLCFESQHFPNAPNEMNFPSSVLRPGEVYQESTIFKFLIVDEI